uniref:Uncharacterized protein n=1 Tax=viral metagenome TaxID=1070528 RepID=A0A6M3IH11_9ZZZZ
MYQIAQHINPLRLIKKQALGYDDIHLGLNNGYAMAYDDVLDFSPYAGNDAGETPYLFIFCSYYQEFAYGFVGAIGGGETLGAEAITVADDRDFSSDTGFWTPSDSWSIGAGIASSAGSGNMESNSGILTAGAIYKAVGTYTIAAGYLYLVFGGAPNSNRVYAGVGYTSYSTANSGTKIYFAGIGLTGTVDDISWKPLTDCKVEGVHLLSEKNGLTRNMHWTESGFQVSEIVRVNIYRTLPDDRY